MSPVKQSPHAYHPIVQRWLWIGVIMVLGQIILGGVTRLTNSGLSITEWNVLTGTLPPLNHNEWMTAFEQYKTMAYKQYQSLHADMTLDQFKIIFFWEYFHRLWARTMSLVFVFPFAYFLFKNYLTKQLIRQLVVVVVLAGMAAIFGWVMVASGLNKDNRTWVSAYKLVIHLMLGSSLFGYLFYVALHYKTENRDMVEHPMLYNFLTFLIGLIIIQIALGGLMAGMRAGLIFPKWSILAAPGTYYSMLQGTLTLDSVISYESDLTIKAIVQLMHRCMAYIVAIAVFYYVKKASAINLLRTPASYLMLLLLIQISLGIITVTNCIGAVPVFWGAIHQCFALLLLAAVLYNQSKISKF